MKPKTFQKEVPKNVKQEDTINLGYGTLISTTRRNQFTFKPSLSETTNEQKLYNEQIYSKINFKTPESEQNVLHAVMSTQQQIKLQKVESDEIAVEINEQRNELPQLKQVKIKEKEMKYDESELISDKIIRAQKPPTTKNVNFQKLESTNRISLIGVTLNLMVREGDNVNEESIINVRVVSEGNEDQFKKSVKIQAKCLTEDNLSLKD